MNMTKTKEQKSNVKEKIDAYGKKSNKKGILGHFETLLKTFKLLAYLGAIFPIAIAYIICVGVSMLPFFMTFKYFLTTSQDWNHVTTWVFVALALGTSFIGFTFILILIVPLFNAPLLFLVKPSRDSAYSLNTIAWMYHNSLTYLVRYTVLDFIVPSPIGNLFFKLMGMKIGKNVILNTSNISDPCLITLEDYVTVGGSASIMAHYGMKGYLIIDKVHIKKGATIGLKASIMGDVVIGNKATITPHSIILPKTRIADNEVV